MSHPVLLFDGKCGFCTRSVLWVLRRLARPVDMVPYQNADLAALGVTREQARRAAWWVEAGLEPERGHRAIARSLEACRGGWPWLGRLLRLPPVSWLAAGGYVLIARYRRYLPGTTPACRRPEWPPSDL
jgi:predicted DCC family thiol-disulfide oxidoreductase YuxK